MANSSVSVDSINDFVIQNFIPYAWSNMWSSSKEDGVRYSDEGKRLDVISFIMMIRPNDVERNEFNHNIGLIEKLHSSNYGDFLPSEYYSCYCLEIHMIRGDAITKNGIQLNSDSKLKNRYSKHLTSSIWDSIKKLDSDVLPIRGKSNLFGPHYSRVKMMMEGKPRKDWSFID